ncbi:hypothetical protein CRG98_035347 [Punica granatum]|uniref:Uncharacterized protein n=1 Tax=Punica granatum TaxID=22663 RepID=A0A2I0IKJ8_PUNGR|nr:hypothetical protein CRG98_035347 [Punica granatum]
MIDTREKELPLLVYDLRVEGRARLHFALGSHALNVYGALDPVIDGLGHWTLCKTYPMVSGLNRDKPVLSARYYARTTETLWLGGTFHADEPSPAQAARLYPWPEGYVRTPREPKDRSIFSEEAVVGSRKPQGLSATSLGGEAEKSSWLLRALTVSLTPN